MNAIAPILLASFGLSLNVLPYIASIPILVLDPTLVGTAYGLFSSFIACNNVILEVACGAIVSDQTPAQAGQPTLGRCASLADALRCRAASSYAAHLDSANTQQDSTPGQTYDRVIYLLIAIKAWQVLEGPIFDFLDGRLLGHTLRLSEKQRIAFDEKREEEGVELRGLQKSRPVTTVVLVQYVSMVIISWVVSGCERRDPVWSG